MIQQGILNPHILSLLARIRHTNTLVIADWAFPSWPDLETVDISLVRGIPSILEVLEALRPNFKIGPVWQAQEFLDWNPPETRKRFDQVFSSLPHATIKHLAHDKFKKLVPMATGLIRTGDTTPYGNIIIESI